MVNTNKLKAAMVERGITVEDIAKKARVPKSTIYRWIKNPGNLTIGNVEILAKAIGMNKGTFLEIFYPDFVA